MSEDPAPARRRNTSGEVPEMVQVMSQQLASMLVVAVAEFEAARAVGAAAEGDWTAAATRALDSAAKRAELSEERQAELMRAMHSAPVPGELPPAAYESVLLAVERQTFDLALAVAVGELALRFRRLRVARESRDA